MPFFHKHVLLLYLLYTLFELVSSIFLNLYIKIYIIIYTNKQLIMMCNEFNHNKLIIKNDILKISLYYKQKKEDVTLPFNFNY